MDFGGGLVIAFDWAEVGDGHGFEKGMFEALAAVIGGAGFGVACVGVRVG